MFTRGRSPPPSHSQSQLSGLVSHSQSQSLTFTAGLRGSSSLQRSVVSLGNGKLLRMNPAGLCTCRLRRSAYPEKTDRKVFTERARAARVYHIFIFISLRPAKESFSSTGTVMITASAAMSPRRRNLATAVDCSAVREWMEAKTSRPPDPASENRKFSGFSF